MNAADRFLRLDALLCEAIGSEEVTFAKLLSIVGPQVSELHGPSKDVFRLVDRRLQALKKKQLVKFTRSSGVGGWVKVLAK